VPDGTSPVMQSFAFSLLVDCSMFYRISYFAPAITGGV
jgi:hypothetical protein